MDPATAAKVLREAGGQVAAAGGAIGAPASGASAGGSSAGESGADSDSDEQTILDPDLEREEVEPEAAEPQELDIAEIPLERTEDDLIDIVDEQTTSDSEETAEETAENSSNSDESNPAETQETADASESSPSEAAESAESADAQESASASSQQSASGQPRASAASIEVAEAGRVLEQAGQALERAADALESAGDQEALNAAAHDLARARVAVIVAAEGLEAARDTMGDDEAYAQAAEALRSADYAITVAGRAIATDEVPEMTTEGAGNMQVSILDKELEEALQDFEGEVVDARQAVLDEEAPPIVASLPSVIAREDGDDLTDAPDDGFQFPASQDGRNMEGTDPNPLQVAQANVPNDIPDGQDDDIVARQLREAATSEADTELREKLWDEYRRYKEGLAQ
jgi:hypothetical protein